MISRENVIESLRDQKTPRWEIKYRSGGGKNSGSSIYSYLGVLNEDDGKDVEIDLDDSLDYLDRCLNRLGPGKYQIKFFQKFEHRARGYNTVNFDIEGDIAGSAGIHGHNPVGIGNIETMVKEKVDAALNAKRLEELEEENEHLRNQVEDPSGLKTSIGKALEHLNQMPNAGNMYQGIIQGLFGRFASPTPTHITGGAGDPSNHESYGQDTNSPASQMNEEELKAIEEELDANAQGYSEVLFRLRLHDPQLLDTLNRLVNKLDSNPGMINMLKGML